MPVPTARGTLQWPSLPDSIEQRLRVLLQTRPGEQLMRARFGVGLQDFIGQPDNASTRRSIRDRIEQQVALYEPRVRLDEIELHADSVHPGWLHIAIHYRILRTGTPGRLGLTLSLAG